jgi:hypothetical protein
MKAQIYLSHLTTNCVFFYTYFIHVLMTTIPFNGMKTSKTFFNNVGMILKYTYVHIYHHIPVETKDTL